MGLKQMEVFLAGNQREAFPKGSLKKRNPNMAMNSVSPFELIGGLSAQNDQCAMLWVRHGLKPSNYPAGFERSGIPFLGYLVAYLWILTLWLRQFGFSTGPTKSDSLPMPPGNPRHVRQCVQIYFPFKVPQ